MLPKVERFSQRGSTLQATDMNALDNSSDHDAMLG